MRVPVSGVLLEELLPTCNARMYPRLVDVESQFVRYVFPRGRCSRLKRKRTSRPFIPFMFRARFDHPSAAPACAQTSASSSHPHPLLALTCLRRVVMISFALSTIVISVVLVFKASNLMSWVAERPATPTHGNGSPGDKHSPASGHVSAFQVCFPRLCAHVALVESSLGAPHPPSACLKGHPRT